MEYLDMKNLPVHRDPDQPFFSDHPKRFSRSLWPVQFLDPPVTSLVHCRFAVGKIILAQN